MSKPVENRGVSLHALDLAERRTVKPSRQKHYHLNLADPSLQLGKTARLTEEYSKRTLNVSRPGLYLPVPEYGLIGSLANSSNPMTCEQLKAEIQEDVARFAKKTDYNSLNTLQSFLLFFEKEKELNPDITEAEAFTKFTPDSRDEVMATQGSTCTGKSLALLEMLEEEYDIKGFVVLETKNPLAAANHAAFVLPCSDGLLLVDALSDDPIVILKPKATTSFRDGPATMSFKIVETPGVYHTAQPMIVRQMIEDTGETSHSQYLLRPANAPDPTVMKRYLLTQPFYPILGKNETHCIKVNFALEKVTFQITDGGNVKKCSIPFKTIESEHLEDAQSREFLTEEFFAAFNTPASVLKEQILMAVKHRKTIKNLYNQVGRPDPSAEALNKALQLAEKGQIDEAFKCLTQDPPLSKEKQIEMRYKIADILLKKGKSLIANPATRQKARRFLSTAALSYDYLLSFEKRRITKEQSLDLQSKKASCSQLLNTHCSLISTSAPKKSTFVLS